MKNDKYLNANNPEFTARAIGENEWGKSDQPIDPESLSEFEELEKFSAFLSDELSDASKEETLDVQQVDSIQNKAIASPRKTKNIIPFPVLYSLCGVAAAVLLVVALPVINQTWVDDNADSTTEYEMMSVPVVGAGDSMPAIDKEAEVVTYSDFIDSTKRNEKETVSTSARVDGSASGTPSLDAITTPRVFYAESKAVPAPALARPKQAKPESMSLAMPATEGGVGSARSESVLLSQSPPPELMKLEQRVVAPHHQEVYDREGYASFENNALKRVAEHPLSTFSIDVDTASYSNVRRMLNHDQLPPAGAVRIEEMINYFDYPSYRNQNSTDHPMGVLIHSIPAPWNDQHQLVRVALQGNEMERTERPDANLVFLVDVSGSMNAPNKLPLVKYSLNRLVEQMEARDRIAVVVYAGNSGLALPSTTANNVETIQHGLERLHAGGSTNGGAGIELAYATAEKHFIKGGINRVILCTDGDFNVGASSDDALVRLIEEKRQTGVFFSILGFGAGNYQDSKMELLSNKGNGNFAYIDSESEANRQVLGNMLSMLTCIAKDVKLQVEFNPAHVQAYRLIGYENRMLAKEDFNDDRKDAGEMGAGHSVTAIYEVVPVGIQFEMDSVGAVDPLKYQRKANVVEPSNNKAVSTAEWLTVKVRYKPADEHKSIRFETVFDPVVQAMDDKTVADLQFASVVAVYGLKLRGDPSVASVKWADLEDMFNASIIEHYGDPTRMEFLMHLTKAKVLSQEP